jgi:cold shock protein
MMREPVKWHAVQRQDDRVICRGCGRRMVPRLITYQGNICRTVCPFCTEIYEDFTPRVPGVIVVIVVIGLVLCAVSSLGSF